MYSLGKIVTALSMLLLVACTTTGPGGQKSLIVIPTQQEVSIGEGMAKQVEQSEKVLPDSGWQAYIDGVGKKLVSVCDRTDIEYHFKVIQSDQINAFATPGGYVYFYSALLRGMDNEAEMAAVMAHEISHVVARHGIKRLQASLGVAMAYQLVFGKDAGPAMNAAINTGMGLLFAGYSRENEREADLDGIYYMVKAGYDPSAAVSMFEKLAQMGAGGSTNVFEKLSSDHPETSERITNAKQEISAMGKLPSNLVLNSSKYKEMAKRLPSPSKGATTK
jgi:predicted Zn-dependent protease